MNKQEAAEAAVGLVQACKVEVPLPLTQLVFSASLRTDGPLCPFPLPEIATSSPVNGEDGVALTRETILRLDRGWVHANVTLHVEALAGGALALTTRVHRPAGQSPGVITVFYPAGPLPTNTRVVVNTMFRFRQATRMSGISFATLSSRPLPNTAVCGRVFASEIGDGGLNVGLAGVTISVDGRPDLVATTDTMGNFVLDPSPSGRFFVHIDGKTVQNVTGGYYPTVGKSWQATAGRVTRIGTIYLPFVVEGTLQPVSQIQETVIHMAPSTIQQHPEFADVRITVPADSLYSPDGTRGGEVGLAPVAPDRLPGTLPPGLDLPLVITIQTNGPSNFDIPAPVCFPNLPLNNSTGAPGEPRGLVSFNHDSGRVRVHQNICFSFSIT